MQDVRYCGGSDLQGDFGMTNMRSAAIDKVLCFDDLIVEF
jgi:hypothetical protein